MSAHHLSLLALALSACLPTTGSDESKCGPSSGTIVNVVDGDTVDLDTGTRLRLLLVDAPEIAHNSTEVDICYGPEATQFTTDHVLGQKVTLKYDESACTDKYGRTLAYVSIGSFELNRELVKQGFACRLYIPPAGDARQDEFADYESEAQTDRTGMWGACTDIPCSK